MGWIWGWGGSGLEIFVRSWVDWRLTVDYRFDLMFSVKYKVIFFGDFVDLFVVKNIQIVN